MLNPVSSLPGEGAGGREGEVEARSGDIWAEMDERLKIWNCKFP